MFHLTFDIMKLICIREKINYHCKILHSLKALQNIFKAENTDCHCHILSGGPTIVVLVSLVSCLGPGLRSHLDCQNVSVSQVTLPNCQIKVCSLQQAVNKYDYPFQTKHTFCHFNITHTEFHCSRARHR